jgi:hypothetical protein
VTLRHLSDFCNRFVRKFDSQLFLKGGREGGMFTVCALQTHTRRHTLLHVIGEFIPVCGEHVSCTTPTLIGAYPLLLIEVPVVVPHLCFLGSKTISRGGCNQRKFFLFKKGCFLGEGAALIGPSQFCFSGNYEHSLKLEALLRTNHWGTH